MFRDTLSKFNPAFVDRRQPKILHRKLIWFFVYEYKLSNIELAVKALCLTYVVTASIKVLSPIQYQRVLHRYFIGSMHMKLPSQILGVLYSAHSHIMEHRVSCQIFMPTQYWYFLKRSQIGWHMPTLYMIRPHNMPTRSSRGQSW